MDSRMSRANRLLTYAMWLFLLVVFLFPIYWLVVSSFKTEGQQFAIPPIWFPAPATLENYIALFSDAKVINSLKNSLMIAGLTLAAVALLGIPAAYSMARFRVGGSMMMLVIFTARLLPRSPISSRSSPSRAASICMTSTGRWWCCIPFSPCRWRFGCWSVSYRRFRMRSKTRR